MFALRTNDNANSPPHALSASLQHSRRNRITNALPRFEISKADGGYVLHIEAEGGEKLDLCTSYDQLDVIADAIDEQLDVDEDEALGVEDGHEAAQAR